MAVISSLIAAAGVAVAAAGVGTSIYASNKQAQAQADAASQQFKVAGYQEQQTGVQEQALALQTQQQDLQIETQKQAISLQQQQDDIRRAATNTDATRQIRANIRQGILARSQALATATGQGASATGGSALGGSYGSIEGQVNTNNTGVTQQLQAGNSIFDLNKAISGTYLAAQNTNEQYVQQSAGLQSQILELQKQVYAAGGQASLSYRDAAAAGSIAAFGSGLTTLGGGIIKNQDTMTNLTNYFAGTFGGTAQVADPTFGGGSLPGQNAAAVKF